MAEFPREILPGPLSLVPWKKHGPCTERPAFGSWLCCHMTQKNHSSSLGFRFLVSKKEGSHRPSHLFEA